MDFVPYKSYKEYRDATLLFYNVYSGYSDFSIKTMSKAENYSNKIPYSSSVGHFYIGLSLLLIVALLGFLLFFIDLELSNQVQHFIKEDFIRCFPT